ncbi:hypothetical protein BV378_24615 [Nostoc sp. RF31YmG]|jgi:hypothetical protein|nr:hypothetical protein BV378_24615 [Nostoc sp. RF31YmG]
MANFKRNVNLKEDVPTSGASLGLQMSVSGKVLVLLISLSFSFISGLISGRNQVNGTPPKWVLDTGNDVYLGCPQK